MSDSEWEDISFETTDPSPEWDNQDTEDEGPSFRWEDQTPGIVHLKSNGDAGAVNSS